MTPSPPAPASTACRPSISRSSTSTPSSSSPSLKPSRAPPTPTNSSCAFKGSAPPPTPPARKWSARWPTSSASPGNSSLTIQQYTPSGGPLKKQALRLSLSSLAIFACVFFFVAPSKSTSRPLRKSEILALVAGDVLSENIVYEIRSNGLSFTPDETYRSLLKAAGADVKVFSNDLYVSSGVKLSPLE